jgi:hypothetical protein
MRRPTYLVVSALLLASAACGSSDGSPTVTTTTDTTATSFVPGTLATEFVTTYEAPGLGFVTDFPIDWRVEEETDLGVAVFIAPQQPGDTFIENFTVAVTTVSEDMTLQEAARVDAGRIQGTVENFAITGGGDTSLGGVPAVSVLYEGTLQGVELSFLHVLALEGNRAYDVTFSASRAEFENFIPVIEQLLAGFRFTD